MPLQYPKDINNAGCAYLKIEFFDFKLAPLRLRKSRFVTELPDNKKVADSSKEFILEEAKDDKGNTFDQINIYAPGGLGSTSNSKWEMVDTPVLGTTVSPEKSGVDAAKEAVTNLDPKTILLTGGMELTKQILNKKINPSGGITNQAQALGQFTTGKTISPGQTLTYTGSEPEDLSLSFEFAPNSQDEAKDAIKILNQFRKCTLPSELEAIGNYFVGKSPPMLTITIITPKSAGEKVTPKDFYQYPLMIINSFSTSFSNGEPVLTVFEKDGIPTTFSVNLGLKSIYSANIGDENRTFRGI